MKLARVATHFLASVWAAMSALSANAADKPPLELAKTGYLYAGGHVDEAVQGLPMVGHLYAEFMIPAKVTHPYPIIMIPGGGQTGTNFTGTATGDEGWGQYFARRGYAVYIVDQVARGRAAYWSPPVYGPVTPARIDFIEQRFLTPEHFNLWPQAHLHNQFPGSGTREDPFFQGFLATQFPSLADFGRQQKVNTEALVALLDKVGPAILLTHSQSGAFGWPVADQRPNMVKAIVAIEPSGPPMHDILFSGAPDWFKDAEPTKISGLGDIPLTYDPPLAPGDKLAVEQQAQPDKPDLVRCWQQTSPARQLPNLRGIPILIIQSEASYHASYDHCTAAWLTQAGVPNTFIRLADVGIHGNGHMMMVEKNADEIATVIEKWLATAVPAQQAQAPAR